MHVKVFQYSEQQAVRRFTQSIKARVATYCWAETGLPPPPSPSCKDVGMGIIQ